MLQAEPLQLYIETEIKSRAKTVNNTEIIGKMLVKMQISLTITMYCAILSKMLKVQ